MPTTTRSRTIPTKARWAALVLALSIAGLIGLPITHTTVSAQSAAGPSGSAATSGGVRFSMDVNGDGRADVVHNWGGGLNTLLGRADGRFSALDSRPWPTYGLGGSMIAAGDVNGDGRADIVHSWGDGINTLLGRADGTFSALDSRPWSTYGLSGTMIAAGDVNGDGRADIVHNWGGGLNTLLGRADGRTSALDSRPWATYSIDGTFMSGNGSMSSQPSPLPPAALHPTRQRIVDLARAEHQKHLGFRETDNRNPYSPGGVKQTWCADFASWVWRNAGVNWSWTSSSQAFWTQTPAARRHTDPTQALPGDVIVYQSTSDPSRGHVHIVVAVDGRGNVQTIGGNEDGSVSFRGNWRNPQSGWGAQTFRGIVRPI